MGRLPLHLACSLPPAPPVYVHPLRRRRPRRPLAWGEDAVRRHRKRLTPHERVVAAATKTYRERTHAQHAALRAKAQRARRGAPAPRASRKRVYRVPISPTRLSRRMRLIGAHLTNDRGEKQYGPCLHVLIPEEGEGGAVAVPRCFLVEAD